MFHTTCVDFISEFTSWLLCKYLLRSPDQARSHVSVFEPKLQICIHLVPFEGYIIAHHKNSACVAVACPDHEERCSPFSRSLPTKSHGTAKAIFTEQSMQDQRSDRPNKCIIVVGAGIIGASITYHLAELGQSCTVIEQCHIACAASGKSGGFLAKDWCDSSPVKALARPSFEMHRELATSLSHDIGYRTLQSYSVSLVNPESSKAPYQKRARSIPRDLEWLDGHANMVHNAQRIGTTDTNAQVLPRKLTHALFDKAKALCGSEVTLGCVERVQRADDGAWDLSVRRSSGQVASMKCDVLVLAMGPWSINAKTWFPSLPAIMAHKAVSLVVKAKVPATALFTEYVNARGELRQPEAYPRANEVYLCQSAVPEDLPDDPMQIDVHKNDVDDLREFAKSLSSKLEGALEDSGNVIAQSCNLPTSPDGIPVIGAIPETNDTAFIATGHSCWGVLNSPATGKAIAETIVNGSSSIDISPFAPSRFG